MTRPGVLLAVMWAIVLLALAYTFLLALVTPGFGGIR